MKCIICQTDLLYEDSCEPIDIGLNINGDITIFTCPNCNELFNLINNYDTNETKLVIHK